MESKVQVFIGRTSGPCTDLEASSEFKEEEVELIKDVLAMVNKATGNKEGWYLIVGEGGTVVIPQAR